MTGPRILALAIDTQGNTSGLSGTIVGIQRGNVSPVTRVDTKRSSDLADNHIGGDIRNWIVGSPSDQVYDQLLEHVCNLGLKWVRTNHWSSRPMAPARPFAN